MISGKKIFLLLFTFMFQMIALGQNTSKIKSFKKLSCPEKLWVVTHPFIAKKAFHITQIAQKETKKVMAENLHDKEVSGGQADAFRHAFWMALLVQEISARKANKLGKAHEKGNYRDFKKNRLEEEEVPDKISSEMDLWNNQAGILIGEKHCGSDKEQLKQFVIKAIRNGEMKIIKKDDEGNFLDRDGKIISLESILGKWENNKVLVPSDYTP